MNLTAASGPGRRLWALPGYSTFWGSSVQDSSIPPFMTAGVLALSLTGLAWGLAAGPLELPPVPPQVRGLLHILLPWSHALVLLLVGAFAFAVWLTREGLAALFLAALLPAAGLLAARGSITAWQGLMALAAPGIPGAGAAWLDSRLMLAAGLQLAWAEPWLAGRFGDASRRRKEAAALAALAVMLAAALTLCLLPHSRGWMTAGDAVVGGLFALALPAMSHLYRREPGLLTHAALLSLVPQIAAQIAALASTEPFDSAAILAQAQAALATLTLLAGVVLDFAATQHARRRIQSDLRRMERGLESSTLRLEHLDRQRTRELTEKNMDLERLQIDYRQVIEGASDLIQSVGMDGRYRLVNRAWLEALGYTHQEAERLTLWDVVKPSFHAHCRQLMEALFHQGQPLRVEIVFRRKSGTELDVEGSVGVRFENGVPVATIGIFRDVTERRRVERMKEDFLATVSHELRTPLTSMLGALGLVRSTRLAPHPERVQELLEIAERNGGRLLSLVNDLLDLQRLETGTLLFELLPARLDMVIEEALNGIQGFSELYKVPVRKEARGPDIRLVTDRGRLAQVLYNLLSNAIKFSPAGEEVWISSRKDGKEAVVTVHDQGPGIPEEFRDHLFEKFAQAEDPRTRRQGGSGLGLSISKRLVEGLGGTIALSSTPGDGTEVTVRLPLHEHEAG